MAQYRWTFVLFTVYRGVPRILAGGVLVVVKDIARKARGEILQNHAHQLAKGILGWKLYETSDMKGHGLGRLGYSLLQ